MNDRIPGESLNKLTSMEKMNVGIFGKLADTSISMAKVDYLTFGNPGKSASDNSKNRRVGGNRILSCPLPSALPLASLRLLLSVFSTDPSPIIPFPFAIIHKSNIIYCLDLPYLLMYICTHTNKGGQDVEPKTSNTPFR